MEVQELAANDVFRLHFRPPNPYAHNLRISGSCIMRITQLIEQSLSLKIGSNNTVLLDKVHVCVRSGRQ